MTLQNNMLFVWTTVSHKVLHGTLQDLHLRDASDQEYVCDNICIFDMCIKICSSSAGVSYINPLNRKMEI